MTTWIGTVVLATMVIVVGPGWKETAAAAPCRSAVGASDTSNASLQPTDVSARRQVRRYRAHRRYGYRAYEPRYYARPYDYEPAASAQLPFGFGFSPWW